MPNEELSLWEKFKAWLLELGEELLEFAQTEAARAYTKYKPIAYAIVVKVAQEKIAKNLTGKQALEMAVGLLLAEVPGLLQYLADTVMQMAYAQWFSDTQGKLDSSEILNEG